MISENTLSLIGAITNILFYLFPTVSIIRLLREKIKYNEISYYAIKITFFNCFLWFMYGSLIKNNPIKISNYVGCFLSFLFMTVYLIKESKDKLEDSILNGSIIILLSIASYKAITLFFNEKEMLGKICMILEIIVCLSPFEIISVLSKNNKYSLTPVYMAFTLFVSCLCWSLYGLRIRDNYIKYPNFVGVVLAFFIFIIWSIYRRRFMLQSKISIEYGNKSVESNNKDERILGNDKTDNDTDEEKV